MTRGLWIPAVGWSLVCQGNVEKSQAILIENLDIDYLVFERTGELQRNGYGDRVIIPVQCSQKDESKLNAASKEIAEGLSRLACLQDSKLVPVSKKEPISYNVAVQIGEKLERDGIKSIILVSPGFRSRRDFLIYEKVLSKRGVKIYCVPVFGSRIPENWINSWHGVQEIILQSIKLLYYRLKLITTS